jgi:hypothetical protein
MALVKIEAINEAKHDNHIHESEGKADFVLCKSQDKLKMLLDKLEDKKHIHFVSNGDWSMHDLVTELLNKFSPADIFITTYALREFAVRQLIFALEKKQLLSVTMLLDARAKTRTPEVYQLASMNLNRIHLTEIHAKVTVIRSPKGCVTVIGSANFTSNRRIEAGIISMGQDVANFHIEWIENTLNNASIFE